MILSYQQVSLRYFIKWVKVGSLPSLHYVVVLNLYDNTASDDTYQLF